MIFINNKYTRVYYSIIDRAKTRVISSYTEKHHIIPRSIGGSNTKENLVALTAREHFVCHLLLTKMTHGQDKKKMGSAVFYLTGKGKANRNNRIKASRLYENLKIELSLSVSEQKRGCKQPPRSEQARINYSKSKSGSLNPNFKGKWITPWGAFDSSRTAAKHCPEKISSVAILNFCQIKNNNPITFLSICRSKGYLNSTHIGKTPHELGFSFESI